MEAKVTLILSPIIFSESNGSLYIESLVSDDDSNMRSVLTHKTLNGKGKLSKEISVIIFLTDPTHCIKVMTKPVYSKVTNKKDPTNCKKDVENRLRST